MENYALRQKANIHWLKGGDSNTRFFHSVVKHRTNRNIIDFLKDDRGSLLMRRDRLRSSLLNPLGTSADSLTCIDIKAMRDGHQISHSQALDLI